MKKSLPTPPPPFPPPSRARCGAGPTAPGAAPARGKGPEGAGGGPGWSRPRTRVRALRGPEQRPVPRAGLGGVSSLRQRFSAGNKYLNRGRILPGAARGRGGEGR